MYKSAKLRLKPLVISLIISLGTGVLSAVATGSFTDMYSSMNKPALSPPGFVFPIVWSILFTLMGISSYIIFVSESEKRKEALIVYAAQLAVNFVWPLIFFRAEQYFAAFIWIILLWILIIAMIILFRKINATAGNLQIPYLLWVTFAGYLNFMVYLLNR